MVRTVLKRRVSCTALMLVKAICVRRPLASTQWMLDTSSSIKDENKVSIGIKPSMGSILWCLFKLYMLHAMTCLLEDSKYLNVKIWAGATSAADKLRTHSFTSLNTLWWDGYTASRITAEWLCYPHFRRNTQLLLQLRQPCRRKGQSLRTELKGRGVSLLLDHGDHRMYQTCCNKMLIL